MICKECVIFQDLIYYAKMIDILNICDPICDFLANIADCNYEILSFKVFIAIQMTKICNSCLVLQMTHHKDIVLIVLRNL